MSASQLPLETLIAILILLFYTISAPLFEKYHFHYMHESGLCMLIGIGITIIAMILNPEHNFAKYLKFDHEIFFTFILPPIIFAAGYNLRRRSFFKYFLYISLFGVLGTIVTFSIVCPLTYIANSYKLFKVTFGSEIDEIVHNNTYPISPVVNYTSLWNGNDQTIRHLEIKEEFEDKINQTEYIDKEEIETQPEVTKEKEVILHFSIREILLFSSVIAATDTVAALTFVKEETEPKLFAILFGEGVINDAVCIVLYGIIRNFSAKNEDFRHRLLLK